MASTDGFWIIEYDEFGVAPPLGGKGPDVNVPLEPALAVTKKTIGSETKHTLNAATRIVVLKALGAACHFLIGADPTADTSDEPMLADTVINGRGVIGGHKISVIQTS